MNKEEKKDIQFQGKKKENCAKCEKLQKEIDEVVYMKYQLEQKYQEELLQKNLCNKQKEDLINQIKLLKSALLNAKKTLSLKEHEIAQLEVILNDIRKENLPIAIEKSKDDNTNITNINNKEIDKFRYQLESLAKRNIELESNITSIISENSSIKKQFDTLKNTNIRLTSQLTQQSDENKNLHNIISKLQSENDIIKAKISKLDIQFEQAQKNYEDKSKENTLLSEKCSEFKTQHENKFYELNELLSNFNKLKSENQYLKQQIEQSEKEKDITMQKLNMIKSNIDANEKEIQLKTKENEELKSYIDIIQKDYSIQLKIPKKDTANDKKLMNSNIMLKKENASRLQEINKLTSENTFLYNFYINALKEKDNSKNEPILIVKNLEDKTKKEYEILINVLQEENALRKKKEEEMEGNIKRKQNEFSLLNNTLMRKEGEYMQLMLKTQIQEGQLCTLNQNLVFEKKKNTELQEKIIELSSMIKKFEEEIEQKKNSFDSSVAANNALMKINNHKEEMILNLNNRIIQLESMIDNNNKDIVQKEEEIEEKTRVIEKLKKDKEKLQAIIHKKKL